MPPEGEPARSLGPLVDGEVVGVRDVSGVWPLGERLSLGPGVERPAGDLRYEADGFIPRAPWEPVPAALLDRLAARDRVWEMTRTIGIVRIPEDAYAHLARLGVARAHDLASYERALGHEDISVAIEEAAAALGEYLVSLDGLSVLGLAARAPGMRTVTPNSGPGDRLVGIHLDAWDELVPNGFETNRICLNLGREERAFLYVPLLAGSLGVTGYRVERFFEENPSCPVVRIRLAPGEAYIAPTEHVLHDGATELSGALDVTLTLRGQFGL